jgi:hypothetical protein
MSISNPKKAFDPSDATKRWQARVDAARKAVTEVEQALRLTATSAEQTFLFRELKEKEQALQAALRAKW